MLLGTSEDLRGQRHLLKLLYLAQVQTPSALIARAITSLFARDFYP